MLTVRTSAMPGQPGATAVRSMAYTADRPAAGLASPWHHASPEPVWKDTANEPLLDGEAKLSSARALRSTGAASVAPNQPPSVALIRRPWAPSAWNAVVVATLPAVGLKLAGAQPWTPSSKSKRVCGAGGAGLTVTVTVAVFDTRPRLSATV